MKTLNIILITFLVLSTNFLFAGNDIEYIPASKDMAFTNTMVAPSAPLEASFEENTTEPFIASILLELAPVTPAEADFSESDIFTTPGPQTIAPETPAFADFD